MKASDPTAFSERRDNSARAATTEGGTVWEEQTRHTSTNVVTSSAWAGVRKRSVAERRAANAASHALGSLAMAEAATTSSDNATRTSTRTPQSFGTTYSGSRRRRSFSPGPKKSSHSRRWVLKVRRWWSRVWWRRTSVVVELVDVSVVSETLCGWRRVPEGVPRDSVASGGERVGMMTGEYWRLDDDANNGAGDGELSGGFPPGV
jgi:hypothetical protein